MSEPPEIVDGVYDTAEDRAWVEQMLPDVDTHLIGRATKTWKAAGAPWPPTQDVVRDLAKGLRWTEDQALGCLRTIHAKGMTSDSE